MKKLFYLFPIILFAFFLYKEALYFYFISDDFIYLSYQSLVSVLSFKAGFYHYNPVFWLVIFGVTKLFSQTPFLLHLTAITLHLLNIILVYYLGKKFLKENWESLIAALLFGAFFSHYEVVYWITGINTSLMVFFYLLSLIAFITFCKKQKILPYFLFIFFFILAILSHEYAVSLIAACFFFFLIFGKKRQGRELIKIFTLPSLLILLLLILKLINSNASLIVGRPTIFRFIASFLKSFLFFFIPNPYVISLLPKLLQAVFSFFLIVLFFLKAVNRKVNLFLFLWLCVTVGVYSATSLPQARYFYLSSIAAILLLVSLLQMSKFRFLKMIYLIFFLFSGIIFLKAQKDNWTKTSAITRRTLVDIKRFYPLLQKSRDVYFINFPDSLNGPPFNAYLFRSGLESALKLNNISLPGKIFYFRTVPYDQIVRNDPFISENDLQILKEIGEVIFVYQKSTGTVKLWEYLN